MKQPLLIIALTLVLAGLSAQTGLFRISFSDPLNKADSLLVQSGFFAQSVEGNLVKYYSDSNKTVESVVLIVDPVSEIVAGWLVRYSSENSHKQDEALIDRLVTMHGEQVLIDEETRQITWALTASRSVSVAYVKPNNLVVYYRDADLAHLFALPASEPESADMK